VRYRNWHIEPDFTSIANAACLRPSGGVMAAPIHGLALSKAVSLEPVGSLLVVST